MASQNRFHTNVRVLDFGPLGFRWCPQPKSKTLTGNPKTWRIHSEVNSEHTSEWGVWFQRPHIFHHIHLWNRHIPLGEYVLRVQHHLPPTLTSHVPGSLVWQSSTYPPWQPVPSQYSNPVPSQHSNPVPSQHSNLVPSQQGNPVPSQHGNPVPSHQTDEYFSHVTNLIPTATTKMQKKNMYSARLNTNQPEIS